MEATTVVQCAELGDTRAAETMQRYVDRMARALASVINIIDPDVIVLGGGVSNYQRLYEAVPSRWGQYVFSDRVDTRLVAAQHGDASGVRGAAWLWP
jgi:fructokinase